MKRLLILTLFVSSTAIGATRDIYDLMYLPNANTNYGFSELNLANGRVKTPNNTSDLFGYGLVQTLGRAFTEQFSLQVQMDYTHIRFSNDNAPDTDQVGISDPSFEGRFRLKEDDLRFDFIGGLLVSLGDAEIKSNGDVNNLRGGSQMYAGAELGSKKEDFQWAVLARLAYNFNRSVEDKKFGEDYEYDANREFLLQGSVLKKLAEQSFIKGLLSVNFADSFEDDSSQPSTYGAATQYVVGTEYQHLMSKDLLLRAGINYIKVNQNTGFVTDYHYWAFVLGANYQF